MTIALQTRWLFPVALAFAGTAVLSACESAGDDAAANDAATTASDTASPEDTVNGPVSNNGPSPALPPAPGNSENSPNTQNGGAPANPVNVPQPINPAPGPSTPENPGPVTPQGGQGGAEPSSSENPTPNPAVGGAGAGTSGAPTNGGAGEVGEAGAANGGAPVVDPPDPDPSCGSHKWACWPMPNPAGSGLPNEASYTDNGDGTVTDNVTGLVWQVEAPEDDFEWQAGIDYCEALSLGGADDWRLPTRIEMTSVMDYSRSGAKFDQNAFPGAQGGFHKTASDWILTINQQGAGAGKDFAWAFNMSDGIVSNAYSKATAAGVRCVRGNGAGEAPSEPAVAPANQYTAIADGEVLDNYTGLIWQAGYSDGYLSWEDAVSYCEALNLNGGTFRLPSIRELATLVDEAEVAPSINREMFPDTQYGSRSNDWYWASHRAVGNDTAAWALNFDDGFTGFNAGASGAWNYWTEAWAKCVR